MEKKDIKKIVLTGGPCAGKTRVLEFIEKHLIENGYYVITIPETATQLIKSKMLPKMEKENVLLFQDIVIKMQNMKEQVAMNYAEGILAEKKVVILYDRAMMDNRAYLDTQDEFEFLLNKNGLNEQEIIHGYDLVIDLISTATCKKELYELDGVRSEPIEDAAFLDKKTTLAWIDHPRLVTVKPTKELNEKVNIVLEIIDNYLNGVEYNNRFVKGIGGSINFDDYTTDNSKVTNISKTYLKDNMVVTHKKYRDSSIIVLGKYDNSFEDRVVSEDEFINLIYRKPIVFTEQYQEIRFTENGDIYIMKNFDDKCYLECDNKCDILEIEERIKSSGKQFVKK